MAYSRLKSDKGPHAGDPFYYLAGKDSEHDAHKGNYRDHPELMLCKLSKDAVENRPEDAVKEEYLKRSFSYELEPLYVFGKKL